MNNPVPHHDSPTPTALQQLVGEFNRNLALRRELAELEVAHDRHLLIRGAIAGSAGLIFAIVGLSQLVHLSARYLSSVSSLNLATWLGILGSGLLVSGTLVLLFVYRYTRAQFCGLAGTRAELHEDLIWLREWSGSTTEDEAAD